MALIENINVSSPNDGLGDSLRDSQIKANNNFAELNDKKVEKIAGKDLSKNDFTDDLKTKLDSLEFGSGVQIQADWIQTDNLALDYIKNKPELSQYFSAVGGFDYEDLATQTTPLNYTTGFLQLTNDILGANTKTNLNPYGVTSVWNDTTDTFDFNQLSIGDEVFLRVHLNLTTTTANQISGLRLLFAEGTPSQYILPIDLQIYHKTAGLHDLMREISFYIGNEDWRTLPVKLQFNSDANASIKVHGFHPYIIRKSVNILDVNDDNYKTFEIANIEVNLDDTTVADGRISFGYNLATSKINAVLFDAPYSSYIYNYDQLKLIYDFSLNFFDKTNGKSYTSFITGFTQIGARYKLDLNETLNYTDYTILDKIEVFINATKKSTGGGVSAHSQLTLDDGTNPHGTTKNDVGLGNVDNTSDVNKPIATATQIALNLKEDKANKGIANGYVPLNASTLIDSIYLPSYVDDIIEVADFASLPLTGETGKIYITLDDNKQYRWSGSVYVNMTDTTIPSLQEVTDVESITTNPVIVNTIGTTALQVYSDTNNGVIAGSDSGVGLAAYSISYLGALISSTSGTGAIIVSDSGTGLNVITTNGIGQIIDTSQFNINDSLQVNKQNVGTVFKVSHDGNVTANSFIKSGGLSTEFLKADGSVDTASYLTTIPNLQEVTDVDGTTTNQILSNASASVGETAIVGINLNVGGGTGVAGSSQAGIGVYGDSIDSYGVFGDSTNDVGVYGESTNGNGVYGLSYAGTAGRFETINGSKIATFFTNNIEKAFVNSDGDIKVKSILDTNNQLGTSGQVLSSTGAGVDWVDAPSLETDPIYGSSEAALFVSGDKAKLDTVTNKWGTQGNAGTNPATDFIGTTDAQPLIFKTNGVERARFTGGTSTNFGLGTTTPTYGLDNQVDWFGNQYGQMALGKTGQAGGITFRRGSDGSPQANIGYSSQTESSNLRISSSGGFGFLTFWCSNSERVRIDANGNFGINTTAPTKRLDINGETRIRTIPAGLSTEEIVVANANGDLRKIASSTFYLATNPNGYTNNVGTVTSVALANGTTGTDVNISGSPITTNGTITLNIPTASATNRGALSSADWTNFNNKLGSSNFIDKEIPTGLINGTNTTFTLANTPIVGSEHIYRNGILQESGAGNDYTISGATITYLTAPLTGDKLRVTYRR